MNKLLADILAIQTESFNCGRMQEFLIRHLQQSGADVLQDKAGNIYATKGKSDTYPCLVAHMDTVHSIHDDGFIVPVEINGLITGINPSTMEQTGIGGDDKCGIYAALYCLSKLKSAKAVFFVDEEVGCIGSSDCWMEFFSDCRFVLQADRKGNSDWVNDISGPLGSAEFQDAVSPYLKKWKYKPCDGLMTDVEALRDGGIGISVANMSAGYYNPHRDTEFICIEDLDNVSAMMLSICTHVTDVFPFKYQRPKYPKYKYVSKEPFIGHDVWDNQPVLDTVKCTGCGERVLADEIEVLTHGENLCTACSWMAV